MWFNPHEACFSETKNRQKTSFHVSEKHTPFPNLCHTCHVTATTRQPAGARGRVSPQACGCVSQGRGSAENAADQPGATRSGHTLRAEPRPGVETAQNRKKHKGTQRNIDFLKHRGLRFGIAPKPTTLPAKSRCLRASVVQNNLVTFCKNELSAV